MVIEALNTAATGTAVDGPRRPVDVASGAVLHLGQAAVYYV